MLGKMQRVPTLLESMTHEDASGSLYVLPHILTRAYSPTPVVKTGIYALSYSLLTVHRSCTLMWDIETEKKIEHIVGYNVVPMVSLHFSDCSKPLDAILEIGCRLHTGRIFVKMVLWSHMLSSVT